MKFSDDELLAVIEDVTLMLGQVLLKHRQLAEGIIDKNNAERAKQKIDALKQRMADEKERLAKIRSAQQRKRELEKIRKDHERPVKEDVAAIRNQKGKVLGWVQSVGKGRSNILNSKGVVVARHVNGVTLDGKGVFRGQGRQGMRFLGDGDGKSTAATLKAS